MSSNTKTIQRSRYHTGNHPRMSDYDDRHNTYASRDYSGFSDNLNADPEWSCFSDNL